MPTLAPHIPVPRPSYSQARENLVKAIPPRLLCLLACGGKDCRYEGPDCWKLSQQAIHGVFSSWVTDDIVAMARPSNHIIKKYNIVDQFHSLNIRSIINMQLPGEHAHCGPPLDPESGFTYSPQTFMENDIYFYNFGMPDYGVSSLVGIIDGVKVLDFAVKEGRVAIHCHAGLGRTGVLIACYLIYMLRISPSEAVHFVRIKRPRSIQTRTQINQVFDFARLLGTQLVQYPDLNLRHGAPFTLQHYLNRQALLLHGQEARKLRHTPKVVYLLCVRLSCLALGVSSPAEIHAELERRSALRALGRTVRETLVSRQYIPLLTEGHKSLWGSLGSVTSWDEPLGYLERNQEGQWGKRSYSDSDLSKMAVSEELELEPYCAAALVGEKYWCVLDLIQTNKRPASPGRTIPVGGYMNTKNESCKFPVSNMITNDSTKKRTKTKRDLPKYNSYLELYKNTHNRAPTSAARPVAAAMADQGPPGENILQRSALLQEELNNSDCGWALLVTESDIHVLCSLLWTWLEKLKDPVLNSEDIEKLKTEGCNKKSLDVLKKSQRHTIYCLLSCVSSVTSLCPHREEDVLQRLMFALTRCPREENKRLSHLMKILKASLKDTFHNYRPLTRTYSTTAAL